MAPSNSDAEKKRSRNRLAQQKYRKRQEQYLKELEEKLLRFMTQKSTQEAYQSDLSKLKAALESRLWETMLAWEEANAAVKMGKIDEALTLLSKFTE